MRHLFICGTPLQARIAESIIKQKCLVASECAVFFYTSIENDKYLHYFERLRQICDTAHLFIADGHTIKSLLQAKKQLKKIHFDTIYLASPISAYSIIALGLGRHSELYTFDDGTANIFARSSYSKGIALSFKKSIAMKILGSSYTPDRIKGESMGHYTIYPQFKNNISDKLIPISLFNPPPAPASALKCSVILGTVFHETFNPFRAQEILKSLCASIDATKQEVFFLPHPRDQTTRINAFQMIDSRLMAEDEILNLLCHYSEIDLYGFCSSSQVNLAQICGVNNILIHTSETQESHDQMKLLLNEANVEFRTLEI